MQEILEQVRNYRVQKLHCITRDSASVSGPGLSKILRISLQLNSSELLSLLSSQNASSLLAFMRNEPVGPPYLPNAIDE